MNRRSWRVRIFESLPELREQEGSSRRHGKSNVSLPWLSSFISFLAGYAEFVSLIELLKGFSRHVGSCRKHILSGFPSLHDNGGFMLGLWGMSFLVCPVEGWMLTWVFKLIMGPSLGFSVGRVRNVLSSQKSLRLGLLLGAWGRRWLAHSEELTHPK